MLISSQKFEVSIHFKIHKLRKNFADVEALEEIKNDSGFEKVVNNLTRIFNGLFNQFFSFSTHFNG